MENRNTKSKALGYGLALFLGIIGAHLFYYRKYIRGVLYLAFCWTYVPMVLGWIDMFFIRKWHENYLREKGISQPSFEKPVLKTPKGSPQKSSENAHKKARETNKKADEQKGFFASIKENITLYIEEDVILSKYKHLKTIQSIKEEIERLKNKGKDTFKTKQGFNIEVSFRTRDTKFAEDSLKHNKDIGVETKYVPLHEYWTTFESLNKDQMKWYFYWRQQALKGNYLDTDLSYIILFTYELMNYTFHPKASFNVSMMVRLFEAYKDKHSKIHNYLPDWIQDMLIELGELELAKEWGLAGNQKETRFYQTFKKYENDLSKISMNQWRPLIRGYSETKFFQSHKKKIYATFKQALKLFQEANKDEGHSLETGWFEEHEREEYRYLFRSAVMARDVQPQTIRVKEMVPNFYFYNELTALFRLSENVTRLVSGMNRQIQVEEQVLPEGFKDKLLDVVKDGKLENIKEEQPVIHSRFQHGKKEKDVTEEGSNIPSKQQIIIPQEEIKKEAIPSKEEEQLLPELDIDEVKKLRAKHQEFVSSQKIEEEKVELPELEEMKKTEVPSKEGTPKIELPDRGPLQLDQDEEDIEGFVEALNENEIAFLITFDNGNRSIEEVEEELRKIGLSTGVFVTELNDKADEYLEDVIVEQKGEQYIVNEDFEEVIDRVRKVSA